MTITVEPIAVKTQPILPIVFNDSLRKCDAIMALTRTLKAPNGVTSVAGANPYAAKLHNSPKPTMKHKASDRTVFYFILTFKIFTCK